MGHPDAKVDARPEVGIDRRVDRTFTSCCCFGIDNIEELTQLSVDTNQRAHIESPEPFSLCDMVHGAGKSSRFFDERQPVTRIDNAQQCLSWDEGWNGENGISLTFSKRLSAKTSSACRSTGVMPLT